MWRAARAGPGATGHIRGGYAKPVTYPCTHYRVGSDGQSLTCLPGRGLAHAWLLFREQGSRSKRKAQGEDHESKVVLRDSCTARYCEGWG
jgi:hypothetical protein